MAVRLRKRIDSDGQPIGYAFFCPGCRGYHGVDVYRKNPVTGAQWHFNNDMDLPTFTPSILLNPQLPPRTKGRCHSFVRNGTIQYLPDSGHDLAGKTVFMKPVDEAEEW